MVMMLTPLQLPSVRHNLSCDGCARDAEENHVKRQFVRENVVKKNYTFR